MKLIADSGSTKTDWRCIDDNTLISVNTVGLNPFHISEEQLKQVLHLELLPALKGLENTITEVHFYGAGCSSIEKNEIIRKELMVLFTDAIITVDHDLLGAARALCGKKPGIAAILGTGSNSCYYNGTEIIENSPALGYVLGDEGSGSYIGKQLVKDFLYNEMPQSSKIKFEDSFSISKDEILNKVYKEALPNRYLASFTQWVGENINEVYCKELVLNAFNDFFVHHVNKYDLSKSVPLNVLGSVAFHFKHLLGEVANRHHVTLGKVIQTPIDELVEFHK